MKPVFHHFFSILSAEQQSIWRELRNIRDDFVLYGGTALALRLGHRRSVDFDFFTEHQLDSKTIAESLPFIRQSTVLQSERNTYTILYNKENSYVKVSFFGDIDFGRVGVPALTLDENIWAASLEDLLATKLKVLMQRVELKDYFDIAALLEKGIPLRYGLGSTKALFGNTFSPSDCLRALEYFEEPNVADLGVREKSIIHNAVKEVVTAGTIPEIEIKSASLMLHEK